MTREQAIARLKKLYGTRAYYRVGEKITSPEQRAEAMEKLKAADVALTAAKTARDTRMKDVLEADAAYQTLKAQATALYEARKQVAGHCNHYRFSIGRNMGFAYEITAHGDTWEECFAKVEPQNTAAAATKG